MAQTVFRESIPNDCYRFSETRLLSCPPGFHWNSQLQRCDLQATAGCSSINPLPNLSKPLQIEPLPSPTAVKEPEHSNLSEVCDKKLGQLIAYPGDCTRFIQCDYVPFVKTCPQYLYWNSHLLTCDKICV
ncbi:hypothetical protein KR084_005423 [Drosophila pseudotakahashii]|nr:hypothetical protein KR084_005423 [Drosophila pseudotakahashii]